MNDINCLVTFAKFDRFSRKVNYSQFKGIKIKPIVMTVSPTGVKNQEGIKKKKYIGLGKKFYGFCDEYRNELSLRKNLDFYIIQDACWKLLKNFINELFYFYFLTAICILCASSRHSKN